MKRRIPFKSVSSGIVYKVATAVLNVSGVKSEPNTSEVSLRVCPKVKPADLTFNYLNAKGIHPFGFARRYGTKACLLRDRKQGD